MTVARLEDFATPRPPDPPAQSSNGALVIGHGGDLGRWKSPVRMSIRAVGEAASTHGMRARPSIRVALARALLARAAGAAHGDVQLDAPGVADLRRENEVVLNPS